MTKNSATRKPFAVVSWCAEDVLTLRPDWSVRKCQEFLDENEDSIQQAMIQEGWVAIEQLLPPEHE